MGLPDELRAALVDPDRIDAALATLPVPIARACHAVHAHDDLAQRRPRRPEDERDPRRRRRRGRHPHGARHDPRRRAGDARRRARRARHRHVEVSDLQNSDASICGTDNDAVADDQPSTPRSPIPGARLVPGLIVGGTDARFYRDRGRVAYGAGLFSPGMDIATFGSRFHGHDERIDVESLALGDRVLDRDRQGPRRAEHSASLADEGAHVEVHLVGAVAVARCRPGRRGAPRIPSSMHTGSARERTWARHASAS